MSLHKVPLSDLERSGLVSHGLSVGEPSMTSDAFRLGIAWALGALACEKLPVGHTIPAAQYLADERVKALEVAKALTSTVSVDYYDNPGMSFDSRMLPREAVDYRKDYRDVLDRHINDLKTPETAINDAKFISSTVPLHGWAKKDPMSCRIETRKECGCGFGQCARGLIY